MFSGALVLEGNTDGCFAILNHIKDRNPLNYDHANLHPAKTANYMSGGHSVIRNNCHYTFIYSFFAPSSITMVTVRKKTRPNLHLITVHHHEFVS